jgi:TetR/AcrR family transcriptional repressor of nem operon
MFLAVPQQRAAVTREKLIKAATELIRRKGYTATTIDDICEHGAVTKGAFFHHFKTKEDLVEASLVAWDCQAASMVAAAPFQLMKDPRKKALGYIDFYAGLFDNPKVLKSCLAGTTAQEISDTNPALRKAANACFQNAQMRFQSLLDDACKGSGKRIDTAALAALWSATLQGSFILSKASQDRTIIRRNLEQLRQYVASFFPRNENRGQQAEGR